MPLAITTISGIPFVSAYTVNFMGYFGKRLLTLLVTFSVMCSCVFSPTFSYAAPSDSTDKNTENLENLPPLSPSVSEVINLGSTNESPSLHPELNSEVHAAFAEVDNSRVVIEERSDARITHQKITVYRNGTSAEYKFLLPSSQELPGPQQLLYRNYWNIATPEQRQEFLDRRIEILTKLATLITSPSLASILISGKFVPQVLDPAALPPVSDNKSIAARLSRLKTKFLSSIERDDDWQGSVAWWNDQSYLNGRGSAGNIPLSPQRLEAMQELLNVVDRILWFQADRVSIGEEVGTSVYIAPLFIGLPQTKKNNAELVEDENQGPKFFRNLNRLLKQGFAFGGGLVIEWGEDIVRDRGFFRIKLRGERKTASTLTGGFRLGPQISVTNWSGPAKTKLASGNSRVETGQTVYAPSGLSGAGLSVGDRNGIDRFLTGNLLVGLVLWFAGANRLIKILGQTELLRSVFAQFAQTILQLLSPAIAKFGAQWTISAAGRRQILHTQYASFTLLNLSFKNGEDTFVGKSAAVTIAGWKKIKTHYSTVSTKLSAAHDAYIENSAPYCVKLFKDNAPLLPK